MTSLTIGQQTKCAMPGPPGCRMSMLSGEGKSSSRTLQKPLIRPVLEEGERYATTLAETHAPPPV